MSSEIEGVTVVCSEKHHKRERQFAAAICELAKQFYGEETTSTVTFEGKVGLPHGARLNTGDQLIVVDLKYRKEA